MRRFAAVLLLILSSWFLGGCGESDDPTAPNTFTPLTSIEISAPLARLAQGTSTPLRATGNFSGRFNRDITADALWSSDNPEVAEVSNQSPTRGRVTALTPGSVLIRAEFEGISETIEISVTDDPITGLVIEPGQVEVPQGLSRQLKAVGSFAGGDQDLTFDVVWSSQNTAVAEVSNALDAKGLLRGIAPGDTQVSAAFDGTEATLAVTVTEAQLQSLRIAPTDPTLANLVIFDFEAIGTFSSGEELDLTNDAQWSSGNTATARVGNTQPDKGRVTTLVPGTTTITARLSDLTAVNNLIVVGSPAVGLSLTPSQPILALDTSLQMEARALLQTGGTREVSELVTWTSSSPNVATISNAPGQRGLIRAQSAGEAQILAVLGEFEVDVRLVVSATNFSALEIVPFETLTLPLGTSHMFSARGVFPNGTRQDITRDATWSSSAPNIAEVHNEDPEKGRVQGMAVGDTQIQVVFGNLNQQRSLRVEDLNLESLSLSPTNRRLTAGQTLQFTLTGRFSDGLTRDLTRDAIWSSSESDIAAISNERASQGRALGLRLGQTLIRARFNDVEIETPLVVDTAP
ncbi:Ig-like domain-containing protein [Geoalkalibacter halelectricus]|uniref:Ig-like domain-containing protein n=1 Tax=Geoalkalibacter halelectricus TaxID=2847045 RepID=UPI003D233CAC